MTHSPAALFTPFKLKGLTLPNRIVMAPMTRSRSPSQIPGDDVAAYYRRRAEGGTGLDGFAECTIDKGMMIARVHADTS